MDLDQVWSAVPGLTTTQALVLLALWRAEQLAAGASATHVAVETVAELTGLATSTAGSALRGLAVDTALVEPRYYLDDQSPPQRRVGYTSRTKPAADDG